MFWALDVFPVLFGHVALGQIKRTAEHWRGLAIPGLTVSCVMLAAYLTLIAWGIQISGDNLTPDHPAAWASL